MKLKFFHFLIHQKQGMMLLRTNQSFSEEKNIYSDI